MIYHIYIYIIYICDLKGHMLYHFGDILLSKSSEASSYTGQVPDPDINQRVGYTFVGVLTCCEKMWEDTSA